MPYARSILIVDDDEVTLERLSTMLLCRDYETHQVQSAEEAFEFLGNQRCDIVLSDIKMPGEDGFELTQKLQDRCPEVSVILMTAHSSLDSAIEAIRAGAFDYIAKPVNIDELTLTIDRALEHANLVEENQSLHRSLESTYKLGNLKTKNQDMGKVLTLAMKVTNSTSSILITGESGTGKDVLARTIHFSGNRASKPFVPINCTAIPADLLESELFGHVRGAFTGADANKKGLFEEADLGTLFLDEIGDMSGALQAKLLRVLQDGKVRRVGSNQSTDINVRVIAATNQNLETAIKEGQFREDLYYRLNVIPIHLPPLRERSEDIPYLASYFLEKHSPDRPRTLSSEGVNALLHVDWPGNIRELENVIERALAISDGEMLEPEDLLLEGVLHAQLDSNPGFVTAVADENLTLKEVQDRYIDEILKRTQGNKQQAARILGVNRATLYRRKESEKQDPASEIEEKAG